MAAITSSFTALALAPGVLKTTMPLSEQRSMGILLVPAPARAMARRESGNTYSCIGAERTRMPSSFSRSLPTWKRSRSSRDRPTEEILFSVLIRYMKITSNQFIYYAGSTGIGI